MKSYFASTPIFSCECCSFDILGYCYFMFPYNHLDWTFFYVFLLNVSALYSRVCFAWIPAGELLPGVLLSMNSSMTSDLYPDSLSLWQRIVYSNMCRIRSCFCTKCLLSSFAIFFFQCADWSHLINLFSQIF